MIPLNDNKKTHSKIQDTIIREDDLKTPKGYLIPLATQIYMYLQQLHY